MVPYWLFLAIPVGVIVANLRFNERSKVWAWAMVWMFFSFAIGLRFEVGGDWNAYIRLLQVQDGKTFWSALTAGDPGYYALNWLVAQLGGSIYLVNTICGMVFMAGVVRFARSQPLPWLALLVSVPYMIIVVGMGYTRQSVALGLVLISLVSLTNGKIRWFVFWVMIGASFHKSAILMLPLAALSATSNRFWSLFWISLMSLLGGYLFVFDSAEELWVNYVEADLHSQGGLVRVLMNAIPAMLFLGFRSYFLLSESERKLWFWMSLLALICIPLVIISSTATDRVALYLIPVQVFVFSRFPFIVSDPRQRGLITLAVVGYYILVQAVWLLFATNAAKWLPYQASFMA
ncbi:hypothetical protein B9Q17_09910 [Marinobacter vinifirmus]|uniref:EpsG family protein n=1 Tax=Marinobacter vinifirmus TaxID=355591 RepID=A0A7Z1ILH9_9GAMM|nr:EpsG family protein [Marinobacter vinifirmus]OZC34914.1 hypothetical protein B9Q17_09910 [Marinobacter vinifirmus]